MTNVIIANNTSVAEQQITGDLFNRFFAYLDTTPKTISTYEKALKQLWYYMQVNNITKPTREDIIRWRDNLAKDHKPSTIQLYIIATRQFFNWASVEGIYPNITEHLKGAKLNKEHKKDYLTSDQVKHVLSNIDTSTLQGKRDYAIIVLMITAGLRTIEVSRANIEDLRPLGDFTALYVQGKGRQERTEYIRVSPRTEKAIRDYLKARGTAENSEPLFCSISDRNNGERLSTRTISSIAKNSLVSAGYNSERLTAHSLRHTAVTLSLLAGNSLEDTQQFARHSNINTTMIYNHALDKAKNKCSESIASMIFA